MKNLLATFCEFTSEMMVFFLFTIWAIICGSIMGYICFKYFLWPILLYMGAV